MANQSPFSSDFLRSRKHCCRSTCLHCPYGYTVKELGIQFRDYTFKDEDFANSVLPEKDVASMLLESASFGANSSEINLNSDPVEVMTLKGHDFGLVVFNNSKQVKKLILEETFSDQGISKSVIEEQKLKCASQ